MRNIKEGDLVYVTKDNRFFNKGDKFYVNNIIDFGRDKSYFPKVGIFGVQEKDIISSDELFKKFIN